jgi:hypothetical protein
MVFSNYHFLIAGAFAFATVITIVLTAPSFTVGINRLKLVMNTGGLFVVVAALSGGALMLIWGLWAGEKELVYLSLFPLVGAVLFYGLLTRRHQTWYGVLGFDDSSARWNSFWNETVSLWRPNRTSRTTKGASTHPIFTRHKIIGHHESAAPKSARKFSFSFNTGSMGTATLGSLARFAAHRLATDGISVFPSELNLSVILPAEGGQSRSYLDAFKHELTVRKHNGAPLRLSVATDVPFMDLSVGSPDVQGNYPVEIRLSPEKLERGPFNGTISIHTDDPLQPELSVPLDGMIE